MNNIHQINLFIYFTLKLMNEDGKSQEIEAQTIPLTNDLPHECSNKLLFIYLYFIEGVVGSIIATMPYVYPQLPNYNIIALFAVANLPLTFKFLFAPFLEKYSIIHYGKRKTWLMVGLAGCGIFLLIASNFILQENANTLTVYLTICHIFVAFCNISLDAVTIKGLKSAEKASSIQSYTPIFGNLVFSMILLKLTSTEFAQSIGLPGSITSPDIVIRLYALFFLFPVIYLHFCFQESPLESQKIYEKLSFIEIISHYSIFLQPKTKYFRVLLFFLLCHQGYNFFDVGIEVEMVNAGFSRNIYNTIQNLAAVPIFFITLFFIKSWHKSFDNNSNAIIFASILLTTIEFATLTIFPLNPYIYSVFFFANNLTFSWMRFLYGIVMNKFPIHALSGMFLTMFISGINFGKNTTIHAIIVGHLGWKLCSYIGLGFQLLFNISLFWYLPWMESGKVEIDEKNAKIKEEKQDFQMK